VGRLVVLEGIDGAGKGTQTARLVERLRATGRAVATLGFPRYAATLFGQAIGRFLDGRFGALDAVHPLLASVLYAGDRFESRDLLRDLLARHDVVVLDRYVASNLAHQGAKVAEPERAALLEWITRIEYDVFALPAPDLVLLLDLPARAAQQLVARKAARDYTTRQADLHEADADYLERVRDAYRSLAAGAPQWRTVPCLRDGVLRAPDDIAAEIATLVEEFLGE
jgi:dTMP kinase